MKCAPIIATRGCPGNCSFCSAHLISGKPIRRRTAESVVNEIEYLMETFGIRVFSFQDNCFTSNGDNLRIICELLLKRDMDIFWDCNCYQTLTNLTDENLDLMRRAGCRMIHMGIESASPRIRKTLRKGCDLAEVTEVAERIKSRGIRLGAWFMLGFPGETMADMIATVKYALALKAAFVSFTPCFPLPGTVVYRDVLEKYGITRLDWSRYNVKTDSHAVSTISSRKLIGLIRVARLSLRLYDKIRQGP